MVLRDRRRLRWLTSGRTARSCATSAARSADIGAAALLTADVTALPLRSGCADVTLAMHMLYHAPDPLDAVRELRRVSRPGGRVVVGLNGADHLLGLRAALAEAGGVAKPGDRLRLEEGELLLRSAFSSVTRHDFIAPLRPPPAAVAAYVRSMNEARQLPDSEPLVDRVLSLLYPNGPRTLSITSHSGHPGLRLTAGSP